MTDPIAVDLATFLGTPLEQATPILGQPGQVAIAAGGLTLLGGMPGLGKTTLIVDAAFHLASGIDWLGFKCSRPLNVFFVENEGPKVLFQEKLQAKLDVWPHQLKGTIHIQVAAWGSFTFDQPDTQTETLNYLDQHHVDLVIGDPIGTLGMKGVGSPEDTRTFVRLLVPLGLMNNRSFLFPVHFTKEPRREEIDQISGAWGGHLDTLMILKQTTSKDELRLSFPKLRWWNTKPPAPLIIGKIYNTHTFELLREEGSLEHIETRLIDHFNSDSGWQTVREISSAIEARQVDVNKTLKARPELFNSQSGKLVGRSPKAVVWQLQATAPDCSHEAQSQNSASQSPDTLQTTKTTAPELWEQYDEPPPTNHQPEPDSLLRSSREQSEQYDAAAGLMTAPASTPVGEVGSSTTAATNGHQPQNAPDTTADPPNANAETPIPARVAQLADDDFGGSA